MTSVTNLSANAASFLAAFDGAIDEFCTNGTRFNVEQMIVQSKLRSADIISIQTKLQRKVDELELVVIDADEQLIEGYSNLTKAQQREMLTMYHAIMEQTTTKPRKARATDGVIRVKDVVVHVSEQYQAVFAVCEKYKVVRAFTGNVVVTGHKVTADNIRQIQMSKDADLLSMSDMTQGEIESFIATGRSLVRVANSLSGDTVTAVLKF